MNLNLINKKYFFNSELFILIPDLFLIICILSLIIISLYNINNLKSLNINDFVIELTLPIIFFSIAFIWFFKDLNLISLYSFRINMFYFFFRFIFLFILILFFLSSKYYFFIEKTIIFEFPLIILLSIEGSLLLILNDNLFIFYLSLELQNLAFYILASLKRYNNFSTEAGLKYFLLGTFSSNILLFGLSLLYGILGTLEIKHIYLLFNNYFLNYDIKYIIYISLFFIIVGLLFKIGSVPFHFWLPDVYEGAPTLITMYFSILPKLVLSFIFIKFYFFIFLFDYNFFSIFFCICGIFSIVLGIYNAIFQFKLKRFLAYSSIVNIGFFLITLTPMNIYSMFSGLFFIFNYIFVLYLLFNIILNNRYKTLKEFFNLFELSLINNSYNYLLLIILSFIFLSFAGIPPFIGFFGKFFIFFNLINDKNYFILIILLFFSLIISYYYLRIIRFIFFDKINEFNFFIILNINYIFIFIFLFCYLFILFFDFFGEYIFLILLKSFLL